MSQDDFETNNPLGSHKGVGKVGGVYIVIPCLPPKLQSKTENIFLLTLYKSEDQNHVPLRKMFAKGLEELQLLESQGISVTTSSGSIQVYFSLAGVIGDNLAVHTILGFIKGFTANFPCRFCLIPNKDINHVFSECKCEMRTETNYFENLVQADQTSTGISCRSVLSEIKTVSTLDLLTVDVMHDLLEGVFSYDIGLVLNRFVIDDKFITCEELNHRIKSNYYGNDETRNKPRAITIKQIKEKYIRMSASESLCLLRNIGILIGDTIPLENEYWKTVILLKSILDIVMSPVIHEGLIELLQTLIHEYLNLMTTLFPKCMKPKHHILVHYPRVMKKAGPLWNLSSMRCESKNRDFKITSHVSLNRMNICKTLAIKSQLRLCRRILRKCPADSSLNIHESSERCFVKELPDFQSLLSLLPMQLTSEVCILSSITFKNRILGKNVILMLPTETEHKLYVIHTIFEDLSMPKNIFIITKDVSDYAYYDEHFQAYKLHNTAVLDSQSWRYFDMKELNYCSVSYINNTATGACYIPKRWV